MERDPDNQAELVQRMVLAELLARRGEGPLARRVFLTTPRARSATTTEARSETGRTP